MPRRRPIFLGVHHVEDILAGLVADYFQGYPDPAPNYQYLDGERGRGRLESALAEPQQTFDGRYLHRTVLDKAAALWRSVTLGHPFVDGNKRMGLLCCHVFLAVNGYVLIAPQAEAVEFSVAIASGQPCTDVAEIAKWLRRNTMTVDHMERLARFVEDEPQYLSMVLDAMRSFSGVDGGPTGP